jgi:hypothetical protein
MKKQIMIALGMALLPALAMAADFNGSYVRNAAASQPAAFPVYWITRNAPQPGGGGGGGGETVIVLKQSATTLQITEPNRALRTFMLDGRPHVVNAEAGVAKQTVTASLQGDNVVVNTVLPYAGLPGGVTTNVSDTWSLSPDGKVLTLTTVRATPALTTTTKQVYDKR